MAAGQPEALQTLRQKIRIDRGFSEEVSLPLGLMALDQKLGGGLGYGALHEIAPVAPIHLGAASGFALSIAVRAAKRSRSTLLVLPDSASYEGGCFYGIGLDLFGLSTGSLLILRAPRVRAALFAMEEALKCRALSCVVTELGSDEADLTATRRLSLAARDHGSFGLLVRHRLSDMPSAAATRWAVAAASGPRDQFGGLGKTAFHLSLTKNRRGPCGDWTLIWNHHDGTFASAVDSFGLAAPPAYRSDRTTRALAR